MNSGSKEVRWRVGPGEGTAVPELARVEATGPTQPDRRHPGHAVRGTLVSLPCVSPPTSALRQQRSFVDSSHHSCSEGPLNPGGTYGGWTVRPHPLGAYILMGESDGTEVNEQMSAQLC